MLFMSLKDKRDNVCVRPILFMSLDVTLRQLITRILFTSLEDKKDNLFPRILFMSLENKRDNLFPRTLMRFPRKKQGNSICTILLSLQCTVRDRIFDLECNGNIYDLIPKLWCKWHGGSILLLLCINKD